MKKIALLGLCLGLSSNVFAHNIQLQKAVPAVQIATAGEVLLQGDDVNYRPWASSTLAGKVRVIQHMAGRYSVKKYNDALFDAIKQQHFSPAHYQTTTIVNTADATMGMTGVAKSKTEDGKRQHPHSQVIVDETGKMKSAWQLEAENAFIVVTDKQGRVQFAKEGKLSKDEIAQVVALVKTLMAK